ncbi:MAG: hypothetical protein GX971_07830 [Firmicutes bacterium]|nr:hypothetical protein [Bacillota bacterium]
MKPVKIRVVIDGIRYDTEKAEIIADDCYWDGHNWERNGRNTFLYKTQNGRYFVVKQTLWQGEIDRLEPLTVDEAIILYEQLHEKYVEFEDAFPGVEVEEA